MSNEIQSAIQAALHGLSDRQRATNDNLANIETPGYLAKRTDFESKLREALNSHTRTDVTPTRSLSLEATNTNGNNVNVDNETVTATDTELKYQAMIAAMNSQFRTLKISMS